MGDGYNFNRLKSEILPLSHAIEWEIARKEWALIGIYEASEPQTCLCGHHPIMEICEIKNSITNNAVEVGNQCVKRFLGMRSDLIFSALKKIRKDISKGLNADSIVFFYQNKILNDWEYGFCQDTKNKRNLSINQMNQRQRINQKVLSAVSARGIA